MLLVIRGLEVESNTVFVFIDDKAYELLMVVIQVVKLPVVNSWLLLLVVVTLFDRLVTNKQNTLNCF